MKVIDTKVLIQVKKDSTCTQKMGGLTVPMGAGEYEIAEVIGVGEKVESVKPGDTIYIYVGSGKKFTHGMSEYRVITLNEIIVIID